MNSHTTLPDDNDRVQSRHTMLAMLSLQGARALVERQQPIADDIRALARTPARRVELTRGLEPWRQLEDLTDDPMVGVSLADGTGITAFQMFGSAFASSPHLLAAIHTFAKYFPYVCQAAYVYEYSLHGKTVLGWENDAARPPHTLRDYVFAELIHALRVYAWHPVVPLRVELAGLGKVQVHEYQRALGCRVQPTRDANRIVLETARLTTPLRGANPSLYQHALLRLAADSSVPETTSRRTLGAIEQLMDRGETHITAVASRLGMSVRGLQKRLATEGYRYSVLLRRARQRRAARWLCESDVSISTIAYALGYSDPVSFQRAFQHWFGVSPGRFRQHHCNY